MKTTCRQPEGGIVERSIHKFILWLRPQGAVKRITINTTNNCDITMNNKIVTTTNLVLKLWSESVVDNPPLRWWCTEGTKAPGGTIWKIKFKKHLVQGGNPWTQFWQTFKHTNIVCSQIKILQIRPRKYSTSPWFGLLDDWESMAPWKLNVLVKFLVAKVCLTISNQCSLLIFYSQGDINWSILPSGMGGNGEFERKFERK